jgi:hypothetical protein
MIKINSRQLNNKLSLTTNHSHLISVEALKCLFFLDLCMVIDDSPYYVFVALCIVVIVVSLIKIAASNENIECFCE